jgi:hypothetical protein
MLNDLDNTIAALLRRELTADLGESGHISFEPPNGELTIAPPGVNLFLYDVRENRELRSNEWLRERHGDGSVTRRRSPVRVDCAYLITAHAKDAAEEPKLLGRVMLALLRYPSIPPELLQGSLQQSDAELPASTLQASNVLSMGEFWQAMGNQPRAALHYTVTFSADPYDTVTAPPVFEHVIALQQTNSAVKE